MKKITVISGKGGTGKTVLTASFAVLAKNKVMVDCDVDAANLHILLHPQIKKKHVFRSGKTALIDETLCTQCGRCREVCRFDAISEDFVIDSVSCEGCQLCSYVCPSNAINMEENISGEWYISDTHYGPFVHAKLGVAEENSGKLVMTIKEAAKEIAEKNGFDYLIVDGPPGTGCPVFASLSGADLALVVTEPTPSGIHDMQRVMDVAAKFNIKTKVVINKYDLNFKNTKTIESFCKKRGVEMVGHIPFSRIVSESVVHSIPLVEFSSSEVTGGIVTIWNKISGNNGG